MKIDENGQVSFTVKWSTFTTRACEWSAFIDYYGIFQKPSDGKDAAPGEKTKQHKKSKWSSNRDKEKEKGKVSSLHRHFFWETLPQRQFYRILYHISEGEEASPPSPSAAAAAARECEALPSAGWEQDPPSGAAPSPSPTPTATTAAVAREREELSPAPWEQSPATGAATAAETSKMAGGSKLPRL